MANTFNAITSGAGGIATTGDSSGTFAFAKDGTTVATISDTGVINASSITGLTTALTAAQGGTGLTAPGTSGNVLTSDGTNWTSSALPAGGVTSLNGQTGAITNTDQYAIGSYVWGRPKNSTNYAINSTVAGSSLYTVTGNVEYVTAAVNNFAKIKDGSASGFTQTLVNTGTWRAMSAAEGTTTYFGCGLWVRIS